VVGLLAARFLPSDLCRLPGAADFAHSATSSKRMVSMCYLGVARESDKADTIAH